LKQIYIVVSECTVCYRVVGYKILRDYFLTLYILLLTLWGGEGLTPKHTAGYGLAYAAKRQRR